MKRTAFVSSPLVLAALMLGCHSPVPNPTVPTNNKDNVGTTQKVQYGYLSISIRWPQRSIQAIPETTKAIVLKLFKSDGVAVQLDPQHGKDALTILRATGQATVNLQLMAPTGTDYRLEARAYAETNPTDADTALAMALQSGITIKSNERTGISLNLLDPKTPFVNSLNAPNGGRGSSLNITGQNFEAGALAIFSTSSTATMSVTPLPANISSTSITVTVPSQAVSGQVGVFSSGIYSTGNPSFKVFSSIVAQPTTPPNLQVGSTQTFTAKAFEPDGVTEVASPVLTWESGNITLGTIASSGVFSAVSPGTATVRALSGSVTSPWLSINVVAAPTPSPTATPTPAPGYLTLPTASLIGGATVAIPLGAGPNGNSILNLDVTASTINSQINATLPMSGSITNGNVTTPVTVNVSLLFGSQTVTFTVDPSSLTSDLGLKINF
ncbi:MAG TPA: hypothetical protein DD435_06320 [Cyanobacteria bacterium UBA8530]|nr:hypothetical protein [Cyanobacteria bacterium UBA8530]